MRHFNPITHVVFDMDGLLLDTESLYTVAYQNVLDKYRKTFTWDVKVKTMGRSVQDIAEIMVNEYQLPISTEEFIRLMDEQFDIVFPTAKLMPGVDKFVRHLHRSGVPIAIATGSDDYNFKLKTRNHAEFLRLFHHVVIASSDSDVKRGKPAPDCFLVAASRFPDKPDPKNVLVFEDAPLGVEAALAAEMQVVMIPDPNVEEQVKKKATLWLKSMQDFSPEQFDLPSFAEE